MFRIVVLISGRGSNFRAMFEDLKSRPSNAEIVGVVCDNPSAEGLVYAKANNLQCYLVERRKGQRSQEDFNNELTNTVVRLKPDLVVLAGFMRIIPKKLIDALPDKIINIHPSLLPAFKGLKAQKQALDAGVTEAGCTVHYVNMELDSGAIIAQAKVPVMPGDTEQTLSDRILIEEHKLYPSVVREIAEGRVKLLNGKIVRGS